MSLPFSFSDCSLLLLSCRGARWGLVKESNLTDHVWTMAELLG